MVRFLDTLCDSTLTGTFAARASETLASLCVLLLLLSLSSLSGQSELRGGLREVSRWVLIDDGTRRRRCHETHRSCRSNIQLRLQVVLRAILGLVGVVDVAVCGIAIVYVGRDARRSKR